MGSSKGATVKAELGEFLRTRRAQVKPDDAVTFDGARRRVSGLRREEVARIAGVSNAYYAGLEQGRYRTASPAVLGALARALRLPPEDRSYLFALAQTMDASPPSGGAATGDDAAPRRMLDLFGDTPVVVCGPFFDMLDVNDAARFLYGFHPSSLPPAERNSLHWMLTSPDARALYSECWEDGATEMIGKLRTFFGEYPDNPRVRELVTRLDRESDLFRGAWRQREISTCAEESIKTLRHPLAGVIRIRHDVATIQSCPGQFFFLMLPVDAAFEIAYRTYSGRS